MNHARRALALSLWLALALLIPALPAETSGPPPLIQVRIPYAQRGDPARLEAAGVDLWEVHPGYAIGAVAEEQASALSQQGLAMERLGTVPSLLAFGPQYHTYVQMLTALQGLVADYPHVARLVDVGDGWEKTQGRADRDLWALKLRSDPDGADARPRVLFTGAIHARELPTAEVALRLAMHLLQGYGQNADITYLLETREVWIVPLANPDGHAQVEAGWWLWRKNTDEVNGPCPYYYGVDLNRNFAYQWGGSGSSPDPCNETYRGPAAASEPETQALMAFIQDQGFQIVMNYHSYGRLVLYPWGYTETPPPHAALYQAIAGRLAAENGYAAGQAVSLYPTHGDLDDWAYGQLGVLSFTTEMGTSFDPPYSAVETLWQENKAPALYLLKIADDPQQAYGPEVTGVATALVPTSPTSTLALTATCSDIYTGGQAVAAVEAFVEALGPPGSGFSLAAADGAFDAPREQAVAHLPWPGPGRHRLYVRGQDAGGHWGPVSAAFVQEVHCFVPVVMAPPLLVIPSASSASPQ